MKGLQKMLTVFLAVSFLLAFQAFAKPSVSPDPVGTAPTDFTITYPFSAEGKKVSGGQIYFETSDNITFKQKVKLTGIPSGPSILKDYNTAAFVYMNNATYTGTDGAFQLTFSITGSEDGWIRVNEEKRSVTNGPFSVKTDAKTVSVLIPVYRRTPVSSAPVSSTPASSAPVSSAPVSSAPVSSTPVSSTPVSSTPVSSTPVSSTPVSSAPASSAPVSSAPVSSAPVSSTPVSSAPASSAPVSSAPVSSAPVSSTPVSSTPVSSTPVSSTPVSSTPVSSTPVSSAPVSSTPVSSTPVSSSVSMSGTLVTSTPATGIPATSESMSSIPVSSEPALPDTSADSPLVYWLLTILMLAALPLVWRIVRKKQH